MTTLDAAPFRSTRKFLASLGLKNLLHFQRDPLGMMMEKHRQGGTVRFPMAGLEFYFFTDPEDVEWMFRQRSDVLCKDAYSQELRRVLGNGLLISEGDFWRRQRGLIAHAFTPKRIRSYGEAMTVIAERFAARLEDGSEIDVHAEMNRVTMEIVAKTLFDADVSDRGSEVGHALEGMMDFFANSPEAVLGVPDWVPTPRVRRFVAGRRVVERIVGDIIRERRASGKDHGDLLSAMLRNREDGGEPMTDAQLRDECVTLFLAGHETTSLLLAHLFVALSKHPDIAARVRAELDRVGGGRGIGVDDVKALAYTDQVVHEGLRLYPSAWTVGRQVVAPVEHAGIRFEPGQQLMASEWAMHRDPRFYPNPEAFVPERWTPEMRRQLPRGAFFPFGDGPRVCIGNHFALMETVLVLAPIVRAWELELLPGERLEHAPSVTLRARRGVKMKVRKAKAANAGAVAVSAA